MLKKSLFSFLLFCITTFSFAQEKTTIPDEIFREFLIKAIDLNPNVNLNISATDFDDQNQIDNSILSQVRNLNIPPSFLFGGTIKDLTGIQAFTGLVQIMVNNDTSGQHPAHEFTEIDLSNNTALETLIVTNSNLVRLDLSNNPNITSLDVTNNHLVNLNLSNVELATIISAKGNYLSCVQITGNLSIPEAQSAWGNHFDGDVNFSTSACDRYTYIPNENFEKAIHNLKDDSDQPLNLDSGALDKKVLTNNINTIKTLDISKNEGDADEEKITDLTGIEDFAILESLVLANHLLTTLDLSKNGNLKEINLDENKLTTLTLSKNSNLETLSVSQNFLASIKNLETNTNLLGLFLEENEFLDLNFEVFTNLNFLYITKNKFTSVDLSKNNNLEDAIVNDMKDGTLTSLNIKNISKEASIDALNNPNLTCITVDEAYVDPINHPQIWRFDDTAQFSTTGICTQVQYTQIPNENFRTALINHSPTLNITAADFNANNEIETSKISGITELLINNKNISDISGIEDFTALTGLAVHGNQLTTIDVSQNTALIELYAQQNQLTTLDVSKNTALIGLLVYSNKLTSLNIKNANNSNFLGMQADENPNLTCIQIDDNFTPPSTWVKDPTATYSADCSVQYTRIPNENFRTALINHSPTLNITAADFNANNEIETSKISSITELLINNKNISDATGIEDFTALTKLDAKNNQLTTLDVSKNTALTYLDAYDNQLTALDVSKNTALTGLLVQSNQLTTLDVSQNTALTGLDVGDNQLTTLDVSQNTALIELYVVANQLTTLDVSQNTALIELYVVANQLTTLDVSQNTALTGLLVQSNQLTTLDVSQNTALTELRAFDNKLTTLDVSKNTALTELYASDNQLTSLNIKNGNNSSLSTMLLEQNPNLTCIQIDDNFTPPTTTNWRKDATATYRTDCSVQYTRIPNENFRTALINHFPTLNITAADFNANNEIETSKISSITQLAIYENNISVISGIEDFTALTKLDAKNNQLTTLDVSKNTALTYLNVYGNKLTTLDVSKNTALTFLDVQSNQLTTLDVSKNTALIWLDASDNQLTTLDVSQNTALTGLLVQSNQLTTLDVSQNTALTGLLVQSNQLTTLDFSKNTALASLYASDNQLTSLNIKNGNNSNFSVMQAQQNPNLTCIQIDDNFTPQPSTWFKDPTATYSADCSVQYTRIPNENFRTALINHSPTLNITAADFNANNEIETSKISSITELLINNKNISDATGIEDFTALTKLDAKFNQLTTLDVSKNTALTHLYVIVNQLTTLDVSKNTALIQLDVTDNQLTTLDVSKNTALTYLNVYSNKLTSLNIKNANNSNFLGMQADENPNLTCIQIDDNFTPPSTWVKDPTATFRTDCSVQYTRIPNENFRNALINHSPTLNITAADFNANNEIETSKISGITELIIYYKSISDVFGIEDFTALTKLTFDGNELTTLDVSKNTALTKLDVAFNQLTNLDVSKNTALTYLNVYSNKLTSLNIKNANNSNFLGMQADENPNLTCIQIDDNFTPPTTTDWQKDPTATYSADCSTFWTINTTDTALDAALASIPNLDTNNDGKITLAEAAAFTGTLDLSNKSITSADGLEAFTSVTSFILKGNNITNIDKLTNASVVGAKSQTGKVAYFARATTQLQLLDVSGNQITKIDVTKLQQLTSLDVSGNQLTSLLLNNGNNAALASMNATNNPNLGCIQVDNVANALTYSNWQKDATASFSTNCSAALSVTSNNLEQYIKMYPNPVKEELYITVTNDIQITSIEIYDTLGKRVLKTANTKIAVQNLAAGVFIAKIITNKGTTNTRFVKE